MLVMVFNGLTWPSSNLQVFIPVGVALKCFVDRTKAHNQLMLSKGDLSEIILVDMIQQVKDLQSRAEDKQTTTLDSAESSSLPFLTTCPMDFRLTEIAFSVV